MKQACRRPFFLLAFFLFASSILFAQVFPKTEFLDVVTLSDGTILKGVIIEKVPERYLEIEIWGGSRFVLGTDQIESVEQTENPDYGTTWIKVDLDAVTTADAEPDEDTEDAGEGDAHAGAPRSESFRAGGHVVGLYLGVAGAFFRGDDWDEFLDSRPGAEASPIVYPEGGISYTFLRQPDRWSGSPWILGARGSVGLATRENYVEWEDDLGSYEYWEWVDAIQIPVEVLGGIGYDRFGILAGIGTGVAGLLDSMYEISYESFDGTGDFGEVDSHETDTDLVPIYSLSLNGYVRLGSRWMADARLAYDGIVVPWDGDRDVLYSGLAFTLGFGYRVGNR